MKLWKTLAAATVLALLVSASASAESFEIDTAHSQVLFKVKHLGISTVTGRFDDFTATIDIDGDDLSTLRTSAVIQAASIDTREPDRDKHVRSADFLDVEQHSEIRFESKNAKLAGKDKVELHGDLTIRGVTRPVVLETVLGGIIDDPWGNRRVAFTASTTVNRKDFGVSWNKILDNGGLVVGDDVMISIEIEAVQKKTTD